MRVLFTFLGWVLAGSAVAAEPPSLLIYINPQEYSHEVKLGLQPIINKWVARGPATEAAALKVLAPHFKSVDVCEGNKAANVIASIKPYLSYSAAPERYNTKVSVRFYRTDGKLLGRIKTSGKHDASLNSVFVDNDVRLAFEDAMQNMVKLYTTDQKLQDAIHQAQQEDLTPMPCEMVGAIPAK
jgi:hypothetical protein